ncbi:hypothetical protein BV25DRAFT_1843474, partial [Artomyces pyxidatus]
MSGYQVAVPANAKASPLPLSFESRIESRIPSVHASGVPVIPSFTHNPNGMTIYVVDAIRVTFGPGFEVQKIVTASESPWVTLANIPILIGRDSLYRLLAPFGTVLAVNIHERTKATTTVASARFSEYSEAVAAIEALHNAEVFGARILVRSSMGKSTVNSRLEDKEIRLSWAAPSKVGYAGFDTVQAAQQAVEAADGSTMRDHWVTATIYDGLPVISTFNVRFHGLPPDTRPRDLSLFGRNEGVMFERQTYSAKCFGVPAVQTLLTAFGPMDHFNISPPPYTDGMVRAWARFGSPDVAKAACELHGIKQRALGGTRLYVHRVHSVTTAIARELYCVIESEVLRLQAAIRRYARGSYLRIFVASSTLDEVNIKLVAEDNRTLVNMKAELSKILRGELVMDNPSTPAWDDFFAR